MKKYTLQILAEDITTTSFLNSHDCAITRAFKRLNLPLEEVGGTIHLVDVNSRKTIRILAKTPNKLLDTVMGMYKYLDPYRWRNQTSADHNELSALEPEDFEYVIELPEDF